MIEGNPNISTIRITFSFTLLSYINHSKNFTFINLNNFCIRSRFLYDFVWWIRNVTSVGKYKYRFVILPGEPFENANLFSTAPLSYFLARRAS